MKIERIFNNFMTGLLFIPSFMYMFGPLYGINIYLLICNLYKMHYLYCKKNILLITDFEETVNDYMLVNLLVSLYKQDKIEVSGIIVNDETNEKAIKLRKYLRKLGIKDNEISISVSKKKDECFNELDEKELENLYNYNIDLWDGYKMILDCEKSNNLSILCCGNIKSLKKAVDNSNELPNISNVYIYNNVTLEKSFFSYIVKKTSNHKNEDLAYIANETNSKKLPNNTFRVFCQMDTASKVDLTNSDYLSVSMQNHIDVPDFAFIDNSLLLLYTVHPELFDTVTWKDSAIRCKNNSIKMIKNKLFKYIN